MFYCCVTILTYMSDLAVNLQGRETVFLCKFTVGQNKKLMGTMNMFKHRLTPYFPLFTVN